MNRVLGRSGRPLAPAEEAPLVRRTLRRLAKHIGRSLEVPWREAHELGRIEIGERGTRDAGQPQRLRVQRLLEDRARKARVAKALTAFGALEDLTERLPGALAERVLALVRELGRDLQELAVV